MNAVVAPSGADLKSRVVEFARAASTEISTMDEGIIGDLVGVLPKGTTIYVAHTPKASLDDVVRVATKVSTARLPRFAALRGPATRERAGACARRSVKSLRPAWSRFSS